MALLTTQAKRLRASRIFVGFIIDAMSKLDKVLEKVLRGASDANISFQDLCQLLSELGFKERIRGSHHIFFKDGVVEIINLQPKDSKANRIKSNRSVI